MHLTPDQALARLDDLGDLFATLFRHGSLSVEIYRPEGRDLQEPHDRDEIYVVIAGTGMFRNGEQLHPVGPGDFLFVRAGVEHRFESFTPDFSTWVFFYGPAGGEEG